MAIEAAFQNLHAQLHTLHEKVDVLVLIIEGDFPKAPSVPRGNGQSQHADKELPPPPVVTLADKVTGLASAVEEAMFAAGKAAGAVRHPRKLLEAQLGLITIQRCLNGALKTFLDDVAAYDAVHTLRQMAKRLHIKAGKQGAATGNKRTLREMARDSGGTWPQWAWVVKAAIDDLRTSLHETFEALADCWQELAEKLAPNSVSVQATNIGQQITLREDQLELAGKAS